MLKRFPSKGLLIALCFSVTVMALIACKGSEGPQGPAGPQGDAGPAGAAGADAQGEQGPAGADGAKGATGPSGADGAKGATGPSGADGAEGTTGVRGTAGSSGVDGQDALAGSANVVVSTVATGGEATIWASGFNANESVSIKVVGGPAGLASGTGNSSGAFMTTATIALDPGIYTLMAIGAGGTQVSAPLVVTEAK